MSKKIFIIVNGLIFLSTLLFFVSLADSASATEVKFTPQVQIPGQPNQIDFTNVTDTRPIAEYIKTFFKYLSGVAGILATVFMMIGGVVWLTAGGSPDKISSAKTYITSSITGLLLAFGAYILLATINTDLVNLRTTGIAQIKEKKADPNTGTGGEGCCPQQEGWSSCQAGVPKSRCPDTWMSGGMCNTTTKKCENPYAITTQSGCCLLGKDGSEWKECKSANDISSCSQASLNPTYAGTYSFEANKMCEFYTSWANVVARCKNK
ncbi:hypothetical protein HGA34_01940 [Candidatus Falkowbacteria bacterium]|nr:hypothetical protein [Candidatus Falkowbacteria bacterium]